MGKFALQILWLLLLVNVLDVGEAATTNIPVVISVGL